MEPMKSSKAKRSNYSSNVTSFCVFIYHFETKFSRILNLFKAHLTVFVSCRNATQTKTHSGISKRIGKLQDDSAAASAKWAMLAQFMKAMLAQEAYIICKETRYIFLAVPSCKLKDDGEGVSSASLKVNIKVIMFGSYYTLKFFITVSKLLRNIPVKNDIYLP